MNWLAMDIGGANLKLADGQGYAELQAFAMWKDSKRLAQELRTLIAQSPPADHLAVTMTGELADCFETRSRGVEFILDAVAQAADRRHTRVYLSNGMLVTPQVARTRVSDAAAANWSALARFAVRYIKRKPALLIDVGSTTCDIVAFVNGKLEVQGYNDTARLLSGELVYTGVERTPLCALVEEVPYRGQSCPVMAELFATTRDVYLLLGGSPEDALRLDTADGRPSTKVHARARLARMIGADEDQFNHRDAVVVAQHVAEAQTKRITGAILKVAARLPLAPEIAVISGAGEFLAKRALEATPLRPQLVSLGKELGPQVSKCAPAHALAVLAREATGG